MHALSVHIIMLYICALIAICKFTISWPTAASSQLEEKQQSLSSAEAKLKESEKSLGESNKEKDITIRSLQEQVHNILVHDMVLSQ